MQAHERPLEHWSLLVQGTPIELLATHIPVAAQVAFFAHKPLPEAPAAPPQGAPTAGRATQVCPF